MGIFRRLSNLVKGNLNSAIDKMTDPAKEVGLLVEQMEEQVRAGRGEVTKARATEKLCEKKVADAEAEVARWAERAEAAVRSGDDALAREALVRQQRAAEELGEIERERAEASAYRHKLDESLVVLEARIREYRARKGTIQAKATLGRRAMEPGATDAFDEFDRMAGRVDDAEAVGEAQDEVAKELGDAEVERKLARLPGGRASDVDDRLAALKKKLEP